MIYDVEYTVTVSGSVLKLVECEECEHEYGYRLERKASGSGTSYFLIARDAARRRAARKADDLIAHRLRAECDPVPCPRCGWYQRAMVKEYRRRWYRRVVTGAWVGVGVLFVGGCIGRIMVRAALVGAFGPRATIAVNVIWGLTLFGAITAAAAITVVRPMLAAKRDPNRDEPEEDRIATGRELALSRKAFDRAFGRPRSEQARSVDDRPLLMTDTGDED